MSTYAYRQAAGIRQALLDRRELALIDVREEADFATAHPLFAVKMCIRDRICPSLVFTIWVV